MRARPSMLAARCARTEVRHGLKRECARASAGVPVVPAHGVNRLPLLDGHWRDAPHAAQAPCLGGLRR
eukprot:3662041-Rhodomonas_salina.3